MEGEDSGLDREGVCECLKDHVCVVLAWCLIVLVITALDDVGTSVGYASALVLTCRVRAVMQFNVASFTFLPNDKHTEKR